MTQRLTVALVFVFSLALFGSFAVAEEQEQESAQDVNLIVGLDGGTYEPYSPSTIREVQTALKAAGVYAGEPNGILDEATMKAIGEYQTENGIQVSGVPSPQTREALGVSEK